MLDINRLSSPLLKASVARMGRVCAERTQFQFSGSLKTQFQRISKNAGCFQSP